MNRIEEALYDFEQYIKNYDINDENIKRKVLHTYRVMNNCAYIAQSINLNNDEIELIKFIGIYHDIARFEQFTQYRTYNDLKSIEHGDFALEILNNNNFIRNFTENCEEKNIILKAIKNHNKYEVEAGLTEKELLYVRIIRDADKLDIMYEAIEQFFKNKNVKKEIENGTISESVMNQILENKTILRRKEINQLERMLVYIAFVFDFNFKYSFDCIEKNKYIEQILNQFNFSKEDIRRKLQLIENTVEKFILSKV